MLNSLYIVWTEKNDLGIPILDEQHRGIISSINSLYYFMHAGQGHEIVEPTLKTLDQYVYVHFKTEEALLHKAGYPETEQHLVLHRGLVEKTRKLSFNIERKQDSKLLLKFLRQWWLGHINQEDKKYVPFVKQLMKQ